jgi:DNA topoisomerase IA
MVSRKSDVLVLWTDMSSEGENISLQIVDSVKSNLPAPVEDYIFRAKYTSLAPKDVQEAFDNLVHK